MRTLKLILIRSTQFIISGKFILIFFHLKNQTLTSGAVALQMIIKSLAVQNAHKHPLVLAELALKS